MNRTKEHKKLASFLNKTYEMVNDPANSDCIAWTSDGMGFAIKSIPDFTSILPRYFKHSNFASFVRQLNMYTFHKSREEGYENVFRHPCFLRCRKGLLKDIKRKAKETTLGKEEKCQGLRDKVQELQTQHQTLEDTVLDLKKQKSEMSHHNHSLLQELSVYKAREEKLVGMLGSLSDQLQTLTTSRLRNGLDSQEAPLSLMEEGQPLKLSDPDINHSDPRQDAYQDDSYDCADEYLRESSYADMEEEIDQLLLPKK